MKTIKNIINEIEKLEEDFELFNSRILEFSNSTQKGDIDKSLLKNYTGSINGYLDLAKKYKKEVLSIKSGESDFSAQKELVVFRLDKLSKILSNTLGKLSLIGETLGNKNIVNSNNTDFSSGDEMIKINKYLYSFYNNYNKNLEFQKTYNINLSLDNSFEEEQEKKLSSLELTKLENNYMNDLNEYFEELEIKNNEFNRLFTKAQELDKIFFGEFAETYFQNSYSSIIIKTFKDNMEIDYVNKNFDLSKSSFDADFSKSKRKISSLYNSLELLVEIFKYKKEYKLFKKMNNEYQLFNIDFFKDIFDIIKDTSKYSYKSPNAVFDSLKSKDIYNNKSNIKLSNKIFSTAFEILKSYNEILMNYPDKLRFSFKDLLLPVLKIESTPDLYISKGLENIRHKLISEVKENNFDFSNPLDLRKYYNLLVRYNKNISEVKTTIKKLEKYISKKIKYTKSSSLKKHTRETDSKLGVLDSFFYLNNSGVSDTFRKQIKGIVKSKYSSARTAYYAPKSSSYSSSSYSSSSSSWSSSSSSFSSSYSSSGSSSW